MGRFRTWLEAAGEGDIERMPWSAKIRRRVEVPKMTIPEPYKSLYGDKYPDESKDRPASSHIFEPTHVYLDPKMNGAEIMVTKDDGKVVSFLTDFGSFGKEPKIYFVQKFKPIMSPGQN